MLVGSTKHTDSFAIKLHLSLCMYMHRSALVFIYIYTSVDPNAYTCVHTKTTESKKANRK